MTDRETYVHTAALAGTLDYSEVRTSGDAVWAGNGYRERVEDASLTPDERRFAHEFLQNLDCDFG